MQALPLGVQHFALLRENNLLYVDKTAHLVKLVTEGSRYFLSRPRRFGKSLLLTTLDALWSGQKTLFRGLSAEKWATTHAKSQVVRLDMSGLRRFETAEELDEAIRRSLEDHALLHNFTLTYEKTCSGALLQTIHYLYKKYGRLVILIDEYDKPILDFLDTPEKAQEMRNVLSSFYLILKILDEYLQFVFITGISKLSKVEVFSALNNLQDISMSEIYGDIAGYTQQELEENFSDRIAVISKEMKIEKNVLLQKIHDYYNGFSFDGKKRVYNPFSVMNFLYERKFRNYWYTSGSPTFIVKYMKKNAIENPEDYHNKYVTADFVDAHEIECASPESFLYQSGYLTIQKWIDDTIILDYPNEEVRLSLLRMYLKDIYHVQDYPVLSTKIWDALNNGDIALIAKLFNDALSGIPYDDFQNRNEYWYRSLFVMLLRSAGLLPYTEIHTSKGRPDLVVEMQRKIIVFEFKFAKKTREVSKKLQEGLQQIRHIEYDRSFCQSTKRVVTAVFVANDETRQVSYSE